MQFDPDTTGAKSATLTVTSNAPPSIAVALSGTGTRAELSVTPDIAVEPQDIDDGPTDPQNLDRHEQAVYEAVTLTAITVGGADAVRFERLTDQPAPTATTTPTTLNAGSRPASCACGSTRTTTGAITPRR